LLAPDWAAGAAAAAARSAGRPADCRHWPAPSGQDWRHCTAPRSLPAAELGRRLTISPLPGAGRKPPVSTTTTTTTAAGRRGGDTGAAAITTTTWAPTLNIELRAGRVCI